MLTTSFTDVQLKSWSSIQIASLSFKGSFSAHTQLSVSLKGVLCWSTSLDVCLPSSGLPTPQAFHRILQPLQVNPPLAVRTA